jgi:hypothetical protein
LAGPVAQTRSASAGLRFLALLTALAPAPAAHAGAWIAVDEAQEIWTNVAGQRDEVLFYETSAYFEAPVHERVAIVAAPYFEQAYDVGEDGWRAEASLAVKGLLWRGERGALALQAGAIWNSWPSFACSETGAEVRAMAGRSFGRSGFVNFEVAERAFEGDCGGERIDLTLGYRPWDDWLAMGQVFLDAPRAGSDTAKVQFTLVRFDNKGGALQFGLRGRVDNGLTEPAIVIGFWGRPGD